VLSIFRTNQPLFSIFLLLYVALLHVSVFVIGEDWTPGAHGILAAAVYDHLGCNGWAPDGAAVLLLFAHALLINHLDVNHRLSDQITLLPGLFYLLVTGLFPEFLHLSPLHLANTFYLFALMALLPVYNKPEEKAAANIFNAGLWIALGSLFYWSYIVLILFAFVAVNTLRAFNIREYLLAICGMLTPYFLTGLYYFWFDRFDEFIQRQFAGNMEGVLDFSARGLEALTAWQLALFGFLMLIVVLSRGQLTLRKVIQSRKKIDLLYWGLLMAGLGLAVQGGIGVDHLLLAAIPLGMLLSMLVLNLSSGWGELFHFLLLAIIFLFHYGRWLGI
jgi:hypothetical protein